MLATSRRIRYSGPAQEAWHSFSQCWRRSNSSAANVAVRSSKTVRVTPPVFTFSNTWQTASRGVSRLSSITGSWYLSNWLSTSRLKEFQNLLFSLS